MTTQSDARTQGGPIIIVPLHRPEVIAKVAAPPVAPNLTYRNGPLLSAVKVFTIFWGADWQQSPGSDLANNLNQFFDYILTSPLMDQLAEYSVQGGQSIGYGTHIGTLTLATPAPQASLPDDAIQQFLQQQIASNAVPQPDQNTLYFIYLPSGITVTQGGDSSCQVFCGYHNTINNQIFYAVMPYPDCNGCAGGLALLDALTSTSSHELCEAITDAIPGQGWYDDNNGEIGDICAWKTKQMGNNIVQLEWSNQNNQCM